MNRKSCLSEFTSNHGRRRYLQMRVPLAIWISATFLISPLLSKDENNRQTPIIKTRYGQIQGVFRTINNGHSVATFLGIPYATAPVNKNRLSPTRASKQWTGVLQTAEFGPACPQNAPKKFSRFLHYQSEDCLHLNIFVPGK